VELDGQDDCMEQCSSGQLAGVEAQVPKVLAGRLSWSRRSSRGSHDEVERWQSAPLVRQDRVDYLIKDRLHAQDLRRASTCWR